MASDSNGAMARKWQQFIDGDFSDGEGAPLPVENPYTENLFAEINRSSVADVDRAVAAARRSQDDGPWPRLSRRERGRLLGRVADALVDRRHDLGGWC